MRNREIGARMWTRSRAGSWRSLLALGVVPLVLLSACGSSGGGGGGSSSAAPAKAHGSVVFWSWAPGMPQVVALFNKSQSAIHVKLGVPPAGDPAYLKMHAAVKAGNPPDLAHVEFTALPAFQQQAELENLSKLGADSYQRQYIDWTWKQGNFAGQTYAIPWASGALGLYYRADLLHKYGISGPPKTWAEFAADAKKVHSANPNAYMTFFSADNFYAQWWMAYPWQAGARWYGTSGNSWTIGMSDPTTSQVADYWQKMIDAKQVTSAPTYSTGWFKAIQNGNIVALPAPQWMSALIKSNAPALKGKWRVAPLPEWKPGTQASANYGGSSLAVLKGAKNPAAALVFAHWLTTDPAAINIWVSVGDGWPAATGLSKVSALTSPDPYYGGENINAVFKNMDALVDKNWKWTPVADQTFSTLSGHLNDVLSRKTTLKQALAATAGDTVSQLKAKGLSAKSS